MGAGIESVSILSEPPIAFGEAPSAGRQTGVVFDGQRLRLSELTARLFQAVRLPTEL